MVLGLLALLPAAARADDPWVAPAPARDAESLSAFDATLPLRLGILGYRALRSPDSPARCPSEPSCSAYGLQALRRHGPLAGYVLTADRLLHEANEGTVSPVARVRGGFKVVDPLENNTFWWAAPSP
jgi:putative component of membrane protein insertase Oxa1/YidC/SpoIIIJ protein YidD